MEICSQNFSESKSRLFGAQARELLLRSAGYEVSKGTDCLDSDEQHAFEAVLRFCNGLQIALQHIGSFVRTKRGWNDSSERSGSTNHLVWSYISEKIISSHEHRSHQIASKANDHGLTMNPDSAIMCAAIDAFASTAFADSLGADHGTPSDMYRRLRCLSVLRDGDTMPLPTLRSLWQYEAHNDTLELLNFFRQACLVNYHVSGKDGKNAPTISVSHTVHVALLKLANEAGEFTQIHARFVTTCSPAEGWHGIEGSPFFTEAEVEYWERNLAYHMVNGGKRCLKSLQDILLDYRWSKMKLKKQNLGGLTRDFEHLISVLKSVKNPDDDTETGLGTMRTGNRLRAAESRTQQLSWRFAVSRESTTRKTIRKFEMIVAALRMSSTDIEGQGGLSAREFYLRERLYAQHISDRKATSEYWKSIDAYRNTPHIRSFLPLLTHAVSPALEETFQVRGVSFVKILKAVPNSELAVIVASVQPGKSERLGILDMESRNTDFDFFQGASFSEEVTSIAISESTVFVAVGAQVLCWNSETGQKGRTVSSKEDRKLLGLLPLDPWSPERVVSSISVSHNGEFGGLCTVDGQIRVWKTRNGSEVSKCEVADAQKIEFRETTSGELSMFVQTGSEVKLVDMNGKECTAGAISPVRAAFSDVFIHGPSKRLVLVDGNHIRIVDSSSLHDLNVPRNLRLAWPERIDAVSLNGRHIVVREFTGETVVWDIETGSRLLMLAPRSKGCMFSQDGNRILAIDGSVRTIWNLCIARERATTLDRVQLESSESGLLGNLSSSVYLLVDTWPHPWSFPLRKLPRVVLINQRGGVFLANDSDGLVSQQQQLGLGQGRSVESAVMLPGRKIALLTSDVFSICEIEVFHVDTGNFISPVMKHGANAETLIATHDGRHLISAASQREVKVWAVSSQRLLWKTSISELHDHVATTMSLKAVLQRVLEVWKGSPLVKEDIPKEEELYFENRNTIVMRNGDESTSRFLLDKDIAHGEAYAYDSGNSRIWMAFSQGGNYRIVAVDLVRFASPAEPDQIVSREGPYIAVV